MERELWPLLYHYLRLTAKAFRQKYVQIQPWILVATMLWAALQIGLSVGPANPATGARPDGNSRDSLGGHDEQTH